MKDDLDLDEFTELQSDALAQLTVRAHPGGSASFAFPTVNRFCMALSCGRAGR